MKVWKSSPLNEKRTCKINSGTRDPGYLCIKRLSSRTPKLLCVFELNDTFRTTDELEFSLLGLKGSPNEQEFSLFDNPETFTLS